jgi:hypothetical protein
MGPSVVASCVFNGGGGGQNAPPIFLLSKNRFLATELKWEN